MNIVCATNMPFAQEAFATLGSVTVKDGRTLTRADVQDAELLAVRSTTKVNRALLDGTRVRFVGTATIGTDHLDIPYLETHGIPWCYAPGCNANSVAEYVATALLVLAQRHGFTLAGKTLAIIGVGNVGSRVLQKAQALGLRVLLNDPPRERQAPSSPPLSFSPLAEVLAAADIVTLHVPLTKGGPDATHQMVNDAFFAQLKRGAIFINSARGPVVETDALRRALDAGTVSHAIIDTWEGEPAYRHDLLPRVDLATPHIAGYSYDGRVNGTVMVYREACRVLGVAPGWSPAALLPPPPVPLIELDAAGRPAEAVLHDLCQRVYDIGADDHRMRPTALADKTLRAMAFDHLRKHYPDRREFPHTRVVLHGAGEALRASVRGLGFAVS
ncbi:MAG: 4-phosphoerythronate dehydrogenase [Lentisphaerae bacterium]|nr:4-phosphoerythronate dehydrogenase [Lentisphaerota bacterium]